MIFEYTPIIDKVKSIWIGNTIEVMADNKPYKIRLNNDLKLEIKDLKTHKTIHVNLHTLCEELIEQLTQEN